MRTIIRQISDIPVAIMRKFAQAHNNTSDYTELHASTWFIGIILTAAVAVLAFVADWTVLYGIQFNATKDTNFAIAFATIGAAVIQILILKFGGLAVKIKINDKARLWRQEIDSERRDHQIQLRIHTTLFCVGMACTLYLSLRTEQAVRAQADGYRSKQIENFDKQLLSLSNEESAALLAFDKQRAAARAQLDTLHAAAIDAVAASSRTALSEKEIRYRRGLLSSQELESYRARYERKIATIERAPRQQRATALLAFDTETDKQRQQLVSKYANSVSTLNATRENLLTVLANDVNVSAAFTALWNCGLNAVSFLLTVGLMFFARGANAKTIPTSSPIPSTPISPVGTAITIDNNGAAPPFEASLVDTNALPLSNILDGTNSANRTLETPSQSNANSVSNNAGEEANTAPKEVVKREYETIDESNGMLLTVKQKEKGHVVVEYTKKNGEVVEYDRSAVQGLIKTYSNRATTSKKLESRMLNAHMAHKWSVAYNEMMQLYN